MAERADSLSDEARVLLFSHRNLYEQEVWRAGYRELESVIEEVDAVDVVAPGRTRDHYRRRRAALGIGKYAPILLNPGTEKIKLSKNYQLLFVVSEKPSDLLNLDAIDGWRDRCRVAICWMTEFYEKDIPDYKSVIKVLSKFDHVLFTTIKTDAFRPLCGNRMSFLPAGIDNIKFCPYPDSPPRFIDVLSIGRRAEKTHQALLRMSRKEGTLYVYDTIKDLAAYNVEEHRLQFAALAKRSRYFIVNPGKADRPQETGGQSEFGQRYFEGLAPGSILIGERPHNNREFDKIFDWPEAVIHVPHGSETIADVIHELDRDPLRQERMRAANVNESLLKHDWAHRWETVLKIAGLQPLPKLAARKQRLKDLTKFLPADLLQPAGSLIPFTGRN